MRVLEVARQFYPKVGGIESCVLNLSRGLCARGHTVEVVTLDRDLRDRRPIEAPASIDTVPIHRIPYFGSRRYPIAPTWFRFADDFDVVHIHAIDFFVDSAALARRLGLLRKPIVVTTHGGIFHTPEWRRLKNFYWNRILRHSLAAASTVVAVSDRDVELITPIVPPERIVTIPNGIDPIFRQAGVARRRDSSGVGQRRPETTYPFPDTGFVAASRRLITFGRVSSAKSIDRIVDLFAAVAGEFSDLVLVVAGPDENGATANLRRRSEELGVASRVQFTGAVPREDLAALVASGNLFISAASHEGFGITTVEALSAGVPVLVTHTGVHDQIVNSGVNGWFWSGIPDSDAVAKVREALLLPDARVDEMRIAARDSAAPFDWGLATDKYERVLESAYRQGPG
jgi:alpha-1,3-mannosyltransferase